MKKPFFLSCGALIAVFIFIVTEYVLARISNSLTTLATILSACMGYAIITHNTITIKRI